MNVRAALAVLLLACVPMMGADVPRPSGRVAGPIDLGRLPLAEARDLNGNVGRWVVYLITPEWEHNGVTFYGAWSAADAERSAHFFPGYDTTLRADEVGPIVIEGTLLIIDHEYDSGIWVEVRVIDAVQLWPPPAT